MNTWEEGHIYALSLQVAAANLSKGCTTFQTKGLGDFKVNNMIS